MEKPFGDNAGSTNSDLGSDLTQEQLSARMSLGMTPSVEKPKPLPMNPMIIRGSNSKKIFIRVKPPKQEKQETINEFKVPEDETKKFTENLDVLKTLLRDFLIKEVSPIEFAFSMAVDEATQILELMTDDSNVSVNLSRIREVFNESVDMHVLDFMLDLLNINKKLKTSILNARLDKYRASETGGKADPTTALLRSNQDMSAGISRALSKLNKSSHETVRLLNKISDKKK